jgi:hypothetical protein
MKCTYRKCPHEKEPPHTATAEPAGIVDEKMRPWHLDCARKNLVENTGSMTLAVSIILSFTILLVGHFIYSIARLYAH